MEKKANILPNYIVMIILLLIGTALILIVYFSFGWSSMTDKEICHKSIIERSVLLSSGKIGETLGLDAIVPLKCKTEKICLKKTEKTDENCIEFSSATKIQIQIEDDIKKQLALALYECHTMLGEGKLNFMPSATYGKVYCLICSRIALNKEAKETFKKLSLTELYKFMEKQKIPNGEKSYLQEIYQKKTYSEMIPDLEKIKKDYDTKYLINGETSIEDIKIDFENKNGNVIIAALSKEGNFWDKVKSLGIGFGIGAATLATGVGGILIAGIAGSGGGAYTYFFETDTETKYTYGAPIILPYDAKVLEKLGCTSFETS